MNNNILTKEREEFKLNLRKEKVSDWVEKKEK